MKIITLIALSFFTLGLSAQDLIILNNKTEIKGKVTEVLEETVKYKKATNLGGPSYSLKKSEIFMILYKNGEKDVFDNAAPIAPAAKAPLKLIANKNLHFNLPFPDDENQINIVVVNFTGWCRPCSMAIEGINSINQPMQFNYNIYHIINKIRWDYTSSEKFDLFLDAGKATNTFQYTVDSTFQNKEDKTNDYSRLPIILIYKGKKLLKEFAGWEEEYKEDGTFNEENTKNKIKAIISENAVSWSFSAKKVRENVYDVKLSADIVRGWHIPYTMDEDGNGVNYTNLMEVVFKNNPNIQPVGKLTAIGDLKSFLINGEESGFFHYESNVGFVQRVEIKNKMSVNMAAGYIEYQLANHTGTYPPIQKNFSVQLK